MYPTTRVFLRDDKGDKFFGEGPCRLLNGIERTGSLRAAAQEMGMAYSKALYLLKHAEEVLGFPLTQRSIGGKGGGGSRLTEEAKTFLQKYETYRDQCYQANNEIYQRVFLSEGQIGCILMASGLGERFGGNKLLAPFDGAPLIQKILSATDTPFLKYRIVVTRHAEVAKLCRDAGIHTVLHSLPNRNDTIRLGLEALEKCIEHHPLEGRLDPEHPKVQQGLESFENRLNPDTLENCQKLDAPEKHIEPEISGKCLNSETPEKFLKPHHPNGFDPLRGCMFCACDQPMLTRETIEKMAQTFLRQPETICRLSFQGVPGNPIIFPRKYFEELKNLPPKKGGSHVAAAHPEQIRLVEAAASWELKDVDTREDLDKFFN